MSRFLLVLTLLLLARPASTAFRVENDGGALHVYEDGTPVIAYRYAQVNPPAGVDARYRRAGYFHPLYDLQGNIISEDFPDDHHHHRGIFWAWPESTLGDRKLNVWALDSVRPRAVNTQVKECTPERVVLELDNRWSYDDAPAVAVMREKVIVTIHRRRAMQRAMDFELTFTNTSQETITLRGSTAKISNDDLTPKGYGGFCFRPRAEHKPFTFTGKDGVVPDDVLELDSPWVDIAFFPKHDGRLAGVTIVQNPGNPGYPGHGWILRHYAFLGASWPHREPWPLAPGESVTLRYRLIVHQGNAETAGVSEACKVYAAEAEK